PDRPAQERLMLRPREKCKMDCCFRRYRQGEIMKKLMLGIIGGAALLTAAPVSLQWSQDEVSLSLDSANARTARPHRTYRRAVCVPAAGVQIGRASCRERVWMAVGAGSLKRRAGECMMVITYCKSE